MTDYQPFPISNFRSGFNESVEPWLLPGDAYQQMINAHLYRGVLQKIDGYTLFANFSNRNTIALAWTGVGNVYAAVMPTAPTTTNFYGYATIVAGTSAEIFTYTSDASATLLNLSGSNGGTGTVNLTTNQVVLTLGAPLPGGAYSTIFFSWDSAPSVRTAIMGIKQYYKDNGTQDVMVFDQRRVGLITSLLGVLAQTAGTDQAIQEIPHDYYASASIVATGAAGPFTGTLHTNIVPGTVSFKQFTAAGLPVTGSDFTDNGTGQLIGSNIAAGSMINYTTGAFTVTFTVAPANTNYFDSTVGIYGNLFTGTISNFFSLTNYQIKAFFTNNVDPIMYYDGTSLKYLNTNLSVKVTVVTAGVPQYDITKCLHVFAYQQRLLLISYVDKSSGTAINALSAIIWSNFLTPLNFVNALFLAASTSEPIVAIGYITTNLIVRFTNSERIFTYTADAFGPFRFDSTNNLWACNAPYSTINYDSWFSSVGRPAIVGSDGVNVERVDEIIPDFTSPTRLAQQTPVPFMNQNSIGQCYGERFDDLKEGWLCYNSSPTAQTNVVASDNILAFNYLDGTYSVYDFPFSCLGFGREINPQTWATTFTTWQATASTWADFQITNNALIDLAGDQFDKVYQLNTGTTRGDNTTPILMSAITKNLNPFVESGELARLGYIDLYVSAYQTSTLRLQFYVNDQLYIDQNNAPAGYYLETKLTFTPTDSMSPSTNQTKIWKRVYVGAVGKIHTIRLYQNAEDFDEAVVESLNQPIYVHSLVLWMKPAGMLFN